MPRLVATDENRGPVSYPPSPPAGAVPGSPPPTGPHRPNDPRPVRRRNTPGLVAAILVGVTLAVQVISTIATAAIFASPGLDYAAYGVVAFAFAVVQGLIALGAVVFGGIGLSGGDRPKALAGIGLGGGAVVLVGILTAQLSTVLLSAFLG
jgi:hypothetical protein